MIKRWACLFLAFLLLSSVIASVYADKIYIVRQGDVLWKIAENNGTIWEKLAEINELKDPNRIFPGQVLKLEDEKADVSQVEEKQIFLLGKAEDVMGQLK